MQRLIMIMACVFFAAAPAAAQLTSDTDSLIVNYIKAIELGKVSAIDDAWTALNSSEPALNKLKMEFPRTFKSYEYWRIKRELEELKARRFLNSSFSGLSQEGGFSTGRDRNRSNKEKVMDNPTNEQRSNRSRVMSFPNQRRRSNSESAKDNPIQEQTSNQERIRNRLRNLR